MGRWNTFHGTLLFGALAAFGLVALVFLVGPTPGWVAGYLVATAVAYGLALAPERATRIRVAAMGALVGGAVLLLAERVDHAALGAALIVALSRSLMIHRARPLRALIVETVLLAGGLALARRVAGTGLGSAALGLWAFFLVQSLFFWLGGIRGRVPSETAPDPFEEARVRLGRLLRDIESR